MAGLRVENLDMSFGSTRVLENVSFTVDAEEFCILLGPSGCGKTTLLRLVAGLEDPGGGRILIGDADVSQKTPRERDVAMVFQSYALYPHMTVFENLVFPLRARKTPREEARRRVEAAADLLGIRPLLDRRPKMLSGGQRQRVAIGRAIVRNPRLFLFDEPLSNLDAKLRGEMRVELAKLQRKLRATVLYVTHDQIEAMTLGQKIVLLHEGRVQQIGSPEDLYHRPANLFVASFIGTPPMNLIEGALSVEDGRAEFRSEAGSLDLGPVATAATVPTGECTLGLRPEAVEPVCGSGQITATLEVAEHLGPETLLHLRSGNHRLVARAPGLWTGTPGETVSLAARRAGMHLFVEGCRVDLAASN